MLKAIKSWWLRRRLRNVIVNGNTWYSFHSGGLRTWLKRAVAGDEIAFYHAKVELRGAFPSASLIEISDGCVTVVQDGVTAKVRV